MKNNRLGFLCAAGIFEAAICILLSGCASAHKRSLTSHEVWLYEGGAPGTLTKHEIWTDSAKGGGTFVFADPKASEIESAHKNQDALGGGNQFQLGNVQSTVRSDAIESAGSAVGNVVGDAVKATVK